MDNESGYLVSGLKEDKNAVGLEEREWHGYEGEDSRLSHEEYCQRIHNLMLTIAVYSVVGIISLITVVASEYPIIAILIAIIIPPLALMILDD